MPSTDREPHRLPAGAQAGELLGRDFITAVVLFHEAVGRLLGLSAADRKSLDVITTRGPLTAGELAAATGLTTGGVTGLIDRLVAAGYAERVPDPRDRRRVLVRRATSGRLDEILPRVFGPLGQDMAQITARYTPDELMAIADFLARTQESLVAHTARVNADIAHRSRSTRSAVAG